MIHGFAFGPFDNFPRNTSLHFENKILVQLFNRSDPIPKDFFHFDKFFDFAFFVILRDVDQTYILNKLKYGTVVGMTTAEFVVYYKRQVI